MKKINLMCPIGLTGYGITSLNIYKELNKISDVTLFPIRGVTVDSEDDKALCLKSIEKQNSFDPKSPFLKIWHQFDLATRIGNGKYGAMCFFEIDKLKPIEVHMMNSVDIVYVATEWAKNILINNGIKSTVVVAPLGVDLDVFNEDSANKNDSIKKDNDDNYIFINIGKWEIRKGHDILIEAFNDAFTKEDKVELWMINHNPFLSQEDNLKWINLYKNTPLGDKIRIIPRLPTHNDLAKVISLADCGVFPARAEGWNNEIPEVMAMNKPVITTNYSAHTHYCSKDNSYLINIDELCDAVDDKFFDGYGKWANLGENQIDQLVEYMRYVYKNNIKTNPNGLSTATQLTWTNTANIIYNTLLQE